MSQTTINLEKGQRIDLTKGNAGLKLVNVGLGWDINKNVTGNYDLDAFAFLVAGGKSKDSWVVFFNNKTAPGVKHSGDNLTGAGDGDDETIEVDLSTLPTDVSEIILGVNIYMAESRNQKFGQIDNAFIRLYNKENNEELAKYDLTEDFSTATGVVLGKMYKKDNEWKFQAVGNPVNGDIVQIARSMNLL